MSTLSEKRVYDEATPSTPVFVAAAQGLVVVRLSADAVGEFSLARRCTARDVAIGDDGTLALATDEATLVAPEADPERLHETGFGPAMAVSVVDGPDPAAVAADESGTVARLSCTDTAFDADAVAAADWNPLDTVEDVRALDERLVAAADGVYRVTDSGVADAGLDDARDVAARGAPLAATGEGLYELGNGWMLAREGVHATVATDGERAHAVAADGGVFGRADGEWSALDPSADDRVAGFAYTDAAVVAATESGSLLANAGEGWRSRAVGVTGVRAVAAAPTPGSE